MANVNGKSKAKDKMDIDPSLDSLDIYDEDDVIQEILSLTFPNTSWRMADDNLMKILFGGRMRTMETPIDLQNMDPMLIPPERYKEISQGHPAWKAIRKIPRVTGSTVAKYAGMHDVEAAKYLGLPKTMHVTDMYNEDWDLFRLRLKHGYLPNIGFNQPGAVFCKWGNSHENNCLGCFLAQNPDWVHQECGLTVITDEMLQARGVYDVFDNNKPIGPFPVQLADSPDGIAFGPDPETGQTIRRACEFKTGTPFIPKNNSPFLLSEYFMRKVESVKPYPAIKPYYVQQCFFHMLSLEVDECYFVSWTYGGGMNTWILKFSVEYVSILLSIIKYVYTRFVSKGDRVPTDLYQKTTDVHFKRTYERLLQMTDNIVKTTNPCAQLTGSETRTVTDRLTSCNRSAYQKFPYVPDEYPFFMKYFFYARIVCQGAPMLKWVQKYEEIQRRDSNMRYLATLRGFEFIQAILDDISNGYEYTAEQRAIDVVRDDLLTRSEAYVFDALRHIFVNTRDHTTCRQLPSENMEKKIRGELYQLRDNLFTSVLGNIGCHDQNYASLRAAITRKTYSDDGSNANYAQWLLDMLTVSTFLANAIKNSPATSHPRYPKYTDVMCFVNSNDIACKSFRTFPNPECILGVALNMRLLLQFFNFTANQVSTST